jgi:hypothetical protein
MGLTEQMHEVMCSLQQAETQAKQALREARAERLSFGLTYDYLDEDIAHLIGLARYMELVAHQHAAQPASLQRPQKR